MTKPACCVTYNNFDLRNAGKLPPPRPQCLRIANPLASPANAIPASATYSYSSPQPSAHAKAFLLNTYAQIAERYYPPCFRRSVLHPLASSRRHALTKRIRANFEL